MMKRIKNLLMYKLKPSLLEDFRIYQAEIFDKSIEELIDSIKGIRPPTEKMNYGSLIHQYLETGDDLYIFNNRKYRLCQKEKEQLEEICFYDIISEMPFKINLNEEILISGKIDGILGKTGIEYKTGHRFMGVNFYEDSIQWKLYTLALNLADFRYYHIQISGVHPPYKFNIRTFNFYPYPEMEKEIKNTCYDFIDFCKRNELEKYIINETEKKR